MEKGQSVVIVHADDFGITEAQSEKILSLNRACGGAGALTSTSALVGTDAFAPAAKTARPFVENGNILMGLHLNFVEGSSVADPARIPLLADEQGIFNRGFAGMLKDSFTGKHDELRRQISIETTAQIETFLQAFPPLRDHLRIDSHQHFHMIPAVFKGVCDAVVETGCTVEHVRVPAEPLAPFKASAVARRSIPAINLVKNKLLNFLWNANENNLASMDSSTSASFASSGLSAALAHHPLFFGLALSGCMYNAVDADFIDAALDAAKQERREVELLFHPGGVSSVEECLNPDLDGFCAFYLSENRDREAASLVELEHILSTRTSQTSF